MKTIRFFSSSILFSSLAALGSPAFADNENIAFLLGLRKIDVPLLVRDVDMAQATTSLWVKGGAPANLELARFSAVPVQAAALTGSESAEYPGPLWRAIVRGNEVVETSSDLRLDSGPRFFCGRAAKLLPPYVCFVDDDGDGRFDARATGMLEGGAEPYRITIVDAPKALPEPLSYRILPDTDLPKIAITLRNCDRDYDRPRYSATSTFGADRQFVDMPFSSGHMKDSSLNLCRRAASETNRVPSNLTAPAGGFVTELGPLVFVIGPKGKPTLTMAGIARPDRLYRMEASNLVELSVGPTPNQAELIAQQAYPYPMLVAEAGGKIAAGKIATGQVIATVPFHHSYKGLLTSDVVIPTFFSKRTLSAGTMVYGFPARSTHSATVNGMPVYERIAESRYRDFKLEMVWCAPIKDDVPEKSLLNTESRSGWRASCLPMNNFGRHTIIGGLPAFNVNSLGFDAGSVSKPGQPPVTRDDSLSFTKPLKMDYVYDGKVGDTVKIRQDISFGDELTSSKVLSLYAPENTVIFSIAGAEIVIKFNGDAPADVTTSSQPKVTFDPQLKWDNRALLLKQLRALGVTEKITGDPDTTASQ